MAFQFAVEVAQHSLRPLALRDVTRDNQAGIRYAVWNNKRECFHEYYLDYNGASWEVSNAFTQGTETINADVRLFVCLFWDWPLS